MSSLRNQAVNPRYWVTVNQGVLELNVEQGGPQCHKSLDAWRGSNCFFGSITKTLLDIAFLSNIFALLRSDREYLNVGNAQPRSSLTTGNETGGILQHFLGCASVSSTTNVVD